MSPVLVRSDNPSTTHGERRRRLAVTALVVVAVAAMLSGVAVAVRGPERVARVSIANPGLYLVDVEVTSGTHDGWLGLAVARPQERLDVHEVVDHGERWVFHFTSGPHDGGDLTLTRAELARSGWRVTVPRQVDDRLAASGAAQFSG